MSTSQESKPVPSAATSVAPAAALPEGGTCRISLLPPFGTNAPDSSAVINPRNT